MLLLSYALHVRAAYVHPPTNPLGFSHRLSLKPRGSLPVAQLVRIPKNDDDDDDDDNDDNLVSEEETDDGAILQVSQIATPDGQALNSTGRSVASIQFMITRSMKLELVSLGYSMEEIDGMDPPRAAAIIAKGIRSSKQAQVKPKSKRDRFELQFTCNVCDGPNSHSISWHAYNKGTVLVTCPGCQSSHLIADNLNWIEKCARARGLNIHMMLANACSVVVISRLTRPCVRLAPGVACAHWGEAAIFGISSSTWQSGARRSRASSPTAPPHRRPHRALPASRARRARTTGVETPRRRSPTRDGRGAGRSRPLSR